MHWFGVLENGGITGTMYLRIEGGDAPPRPREAVRQERPGSER